MNDGRKVITIAHPEQSSGELKMFQATGCILFMFFLFFFFFVYYTTPTVSLNSLSLPLFTNYLTSQDS